MNQDLTAAKERNVSRALSMQISNFAEYGDGFSFTVATELDAYKAAFQYHDQTSSRVAVKFAPNVNAWLVQVYSQNRS